MIPDSMGRRKNLPAPKGCKDNKLYAEIRYQITPHATREIYKQVERIRVASEKQEPLTTCLHQFVSRNYATSLCRRY